MIKYNIIQRGQPGVTGGGEKKFYADISRGPRVNIDKLANRISEISPLSPLDIKSALLAFLDIVPQYLIEGRTVDLGEFGSINVTLSSSGAETEEDFDVDMIKRNRIHFRPSAEFRRMMNNVRYKKESDLIVFIFLRRTAMCAFFVELIQALYCRK